MQHHITIPRPVAVFILQQGRWLVAAVLLLTLGAVWQIRGTPLSISALESFTSDFETFAAYQARAELFGGDSDMLVFVATDEGDQLFTPKVLNAIRSAAQEISQLPQVEKLVALTEVPFLIDRPRNAIQQAVIDAARQQILQGQLPALAQAIALDPWWPKDLADQSAINLQSVKQALMQDSLIHRRLLSADGRSQCMLVRLKPEKMGLAAKWQLRNQMEQALQRQGLGSQQLHLSGLTITESWILAELVSCLRFQLPLGVFIIGIIVFSMYRSLSIAALTIVVGAIASVWAVAATGVVFGKITILVAAVPLLIMVISTSDTIHLVSAYTKELAKGLDREQALVQVIQDVGGACVLTSLTTLVGFLSLLLIPVTAIRHLAVTAGVGVAVALILAVTLVPIGIVWLRFTAPYERSRTSSLANTLVGRLIATCSWITTSYPRTVVGLHLIGLVVAIYYAMGLQFDPNLTQRFQPNHPMPVSIDYFNTNFCGTNVVELFVEGDSKELLAPENLEKLQVLQNKLLAIPEIQSVTGPNDLFFLVNRIVGYQSNTGLPPTLLAAQTSIQLLERLQPEMIRAMVSPDGTQLRITAYTSLSGFFEVLELSKRISTIAQEQLPTSLSAEVSGVMPVIAQSVETIVDSQFSGLVFCFVVVLMIVMLAVRSLRLGLISLPPNVLPLLALAGWLSYRSPTIDSDFIIIFTIAFGIAVDDTVHFLHRYDVEFSRWGDRRKAVESAYQYSGNAIVQTTVVLGMGLMPLALSNYLTIWMLGTYLVLTLVLAVLADLLLLPALILVFAEKD